MLTSTYAHVPWSKGFQNQFQALNLIENCTLKMSLCKLVYNGDSVLWMGAAPGQCKNAFNGGVDRATGSARLRRHTLAPHAQPAESDIGEDSASRQVQHLRLARASRRSSGVGARALPRALRPFDLEGARVDACEELLPLDEACLGCPARRQAGRQAGSK